MTGRRIDESCGEDPHGVYERRTRALEWFDPIVRNGDGVLVEVTTTDGGPLIAVEMTRTDEGEVMGSRGKSNRSECS